MEKCIGCGSKEIVFLCNGSKNRFSLKDVPQIIGIMGECKADRELRITSHKYLCEDCGLVMEEFDEESLKNYNEYKQYIQS